MPGEFQHRLFGCFDNCTVCIITYFAPCYTAGKVAEKVGESCVKHALLMFVPIAGFVCRAIIREKVREQRSIDGTFGKDVCLSFFCGCCALIQEAQEVNALGSVAMSSEQSIARE